MITDRLWGTTLRELSFDVCAQTVTFGIGESINDASSSELRLSGVSEFRFFNAIEGPWEYAEFTEIHAERDEGSDHWRFEIMLWSEDAGISGRCTSITLDGLELTTHHDA